MNKLKLVLFLTIITGLFFTACLKKDDYTLVLPQNIDSINIDNSNEVQNGLNVRNGSLISGTLPGSTSGNNSLSNSQTSISVKNGNILTIPIIYSSQTNIKTVYIQVVGATNGYFAVTPTISTSTNGYAYISLEIPDYLSNGNFEIIYLLEYTNGTTSNKVQTNINVTNINITCENAYMSGTSGLTFTNLYLGEGAGEVKIAYDTYSVPDRIDIYQGETWLTGTGSNPNSPIPPMCNCDSPLPGFVGENGELSFFYNPNKGSSIVVVVSGCLPKGTAWEWQLIKAPGCFGN